MKDKRIAVGIAALIIVLYFVLKSLLTSHEARIRGEIESAVDAFNNLHAGSCVEVLTDDYVDRTSKARRDVIKQYLVALFLQKQNRYSGQFRYPARIVDGQLEITVNEDGETAVAKGRIAFDERDAAQPRWIAEVVAAFIRKDGDWRIRETTFTSLEGKRPF